jgi:ATP-dependent Clp protease ATP-binding subunit ClpB
LQQDLQKHFRPEFINRLDDIIVFNSLSTEVLLEIVDQQIVQLVHMLHAEK